MGQWKAASAQAFLEELIALRSTSWRYHACHGIQSELPIGVQKGEFEKSMT